MLKTGALFLVACFIITTSVNCEEICGSDLKTYHDLEDLKSAQSNQPTLLILHLGPCANDKYKLIQRSLSYPYQNYNNIYRNNKYLRQPNLYSKFWKPLRRPRERGSLNMLRQYYPAHNQGYPQNYQPYQPQQPSNSQGFPQQQQSNTQGAQGYPQQQQSNTQGVQGYPQQQQVLRPPRAYPAQPLF